MNQVLERFPLLTDLSMMRNPACPGLMDIQRPDMEACRLYRTYVVFRAPQLVTVDGIDVTEEVGNCYLFFILPRRKSYHGEMPLCQGGLYFP